MSMIFMRREKDIVEKQIRLNGHVVRARIPVRTISLEEAIERGRKIFAKYR